MKKIWIYNINGEKSEAVANSYSQNADFNVNRITVQGTTLMGTWSEYRRNKIQSKR